MGRCWVCARVCWATASEAANNVWTAWPGVLCTAIKKKNSRTQRDKGSASRSIGHNVWCFGTAIARTIRNTIVACLVQQDSLQGLLHSVEEGTRRWIGTQQQVMWSKPLFGEGYDAHYSEAVNFILPLINFILSGNWCTVNMCIGKKTKKTTNKRGDYSQQ